jgi:hypothetical protein
MENFSWVGLFNAGNEGRPRFACLAGYQWLKPAILAIQEAEIRRITV